MFLTFVFALNCSAVFSFCLLIWLTLLLSVPLVLGKCSNKLLLLHSATIFMVCRITKVGCEIPNYSLSLTGTKLVFLDRVSMLL